MARLRVFPEAPAGRGRYPIYMKRNCRSLRVALLGEGEDAERWAAILSGPTELCSLHEELPGRIDALVLAPGCSDPFARAKEALEADIPVLYAAPFLLSPWQAGTLTNLSRAQGRLLQFAEPFRYRRGFSFLQRLLAGEEPFWCPLYLRGLRVAPPGEPARIDELATEELAICQTLLGGTPHSVTAVASRRDEVAEVCAVFLTLQYRNGLLAQCTISLAEENGISEVVVTTPSRTVVLDDQDPVAPLRFVGGKDTDLFAEGAAFVTAPQGRAQGAPALDPLAEEAQCFLSAVAAGDGSHGNGERWTQVAALWWAARQSMSFGGPAEVPSIRPGDAAPPPFRVIRGGGKTVPAVGRRPRLTVVAR